MNRPAANRHDPLDIYDVRSLLSDEEQLIRDSVARLVDEQALPIVRECFENQRFPRELIPQLANLGLLGSSLQCWAPQASPPSTTLFVTH